MAVSGVPKKTVVATPASDASSVVTAAEHINDKQQPGVPKKTVVATAASDNPREGSAAEQITEHNVVPKSVSPIHGRCKSGRAWKKPSVVRTSIRSMRVDPKQTGKLAKLTPFQVRERKKRKRDRMRQIQSDIIEDRKRRKRAERAARENKERRRADAEWRNGKMQIITNANKIKKMSKRQLRQLRKMSVDADGTKRLVNPWTGEAYD